MAIGIGQDVTGVKTAFASEWCQERVEAQVNCIKHQIRIVFGRANFDVVRLRVLHRVSSLLISGFRNFLLAQTKQAGEVISQRHFPRTIFVRSTGNTCCFAHNLGYERVWSSRDQGPKIVCRDPSISMKICVLMCDSLRGLGDRRHNEQEWYPIK